MKALDFIKTHYKPIQPTVRLGDANILYRELAPQPELATFVYCFWELKTKVALQTPYVYRVVSDGCIDIFFDHTQPSENFVMGFCRKYTQFPIGKTFHYTGIRFLPTAFPQLFDCNAQHLSNQSQPLSAVLPKLSQWMGITLQPTYSLEQVATAFTVKLKPLLDSKVPNVDRRFLKALNTIFEHKGHLDIETDLVGLSPRQFRRLFNYYLGTTPKAFCNVVRFQYILNAQPSKETLKTDKLYFDVGFFDQAHFIKHFKTFYGVTPSEALY